MCESEPEDQTPSLLHPLLKKANLWDDLKSLHAIYRDYLKHEDDLIHQRSWWHLLLQGFLFATFGVILQSDKSPILDHADRLEILSWFAYGGIAICIAAILGVLAANLAIFRLRREWKAAVENKKINPKTPREVDSDYESLCRLLPPLTAGGHWYAFPLGLFPSIAIPLAVGIVWSFLAIKVPRLTEPKSTADVPTTICECNSMSPSPTTSSESPKAR